MLDDFYISRDGNPSVDYLSDIHILKRPAVRKAVYEPFSDNGYIFEFAARNGNVNVLFNVHIGAFSARNDKRTARLRSVRVSIAP